MGYKLYIITINKTAILTADPAYMNLRTCRCFNEYRNQTYTEPINFIAGHTEYNPIYRNIARSFIDCILDAKINGQGFALILEDDFRCTHKDALNEFIKTYEKVKNRLDTKHIFMAGAYEGDPCYDLDDLGIVELKGKISGLHAIIVPKEVYDDFLLIDFQYQMDYWLSQMNRGISFYSMWPMTIMQYDGYSYNTGQVTNYNSWIGNRFKIREFENG